MHPLRVAVIARAVMPLHGIGGLERSVHDLVRHLAARDVRVTLITPPPGHMRRQVTDPFGSSKIDVRHVAYVTFPFANRRGTTVLDRSTAYPVFGWRAGRLALSLVREGKADVVHAFGASALGYALARLRAFGATAGKRASAPLVLNPQGLEEFGGTAERLPSGKAIGYWPLRQAVRACSRAADAVISTDASLDDTVARHLRLRPGQSRTIPNGIDLIATGGLAGPGDGRLIRDRHGIGSNETVLLSAGRIEHNKGFDVLADALARSLGPGASVPQPGWRWVIAGAGPFKRELERRIDALGLRAHVCLAGRVSDADLHAWYETATLFVHPTRYEGSSIVTLEAMAHRKPIVATRAGGLPDKVRPGVNGWLVPPGDATALGQAISDALSDPTRLRAMGEHSRQIVEAEFAWSVLIEKYLALYGELLNGSAGSPDARVR
jgi:glycogen(starch) synthase